MADLTIEDIYRVPDREPNAAQKRAIEATDGPMRIIAGPGSGKTLVLVVRWSGFCMKGWKRRGRWTVRFGQDSRSISLVANVAVLSGMSFRRS